VADVALGDTQRDFASHALVAHLVALGAVAFSSGAGVTTTLLLCGRRGTYGTGLPLVARSNFAAALAWQA
jgi:hypothetical protein